jgi:hypothetical protein
MTPKQRRLTEKQIKSAKDAADAITGIGDWGTTPDGRFFWAYVVESLVNQATNGTNDGKPWIDLELTDEDAKQRPWAMVRDRETGNWIGPKTLVAKSGYHYVLNGETSPNKELQGVSAWRFARLATPEEIEAANAERQ